MSSSPPANLGPGEFAPSNQGPLAIALGLSLLAVFVWIFWAFITRQFEWAIREQADWGHTLAIPFIAAWFVYLNRAKILAEPFRPAWSGLILVMLGLGVYSISALGPMMFKHHNVMGFGVGATLFGLVLFIFGWRAMRWLWFPTLYLVVFGQTVSDRFLEVVTYRLQDIAAAGSYYGLSLLGFDVERAGNTLQIFHDGELIPVNIAEACSGMRMLVAFLALGVAMAYQGLRYPWQRVILVLFAVPTAVFVNILRVMTLGVLSIADAGFAAGDFHTMIGLLWLIPAFFLYLGIMWILRNLVVDEDEETTRVTGADDPPLRLRITRPTRDAFVISVLLLVGGGIAFQVAARSLDVHLRKEAVLPRQALDSIPYNVGAWSSERGSEQRMDASGVEQLGTDLYLNRFYRNELDPDLPVIQLHLAYYTGHIDTIPHVPDRCLVAGGLTQEQPEPLNYDLDIDVQQWPEDPRYTLDGDPYRLASLTAPGGESELVRMPVGDLQLRTTEFGDPTRPELRIFAGYFFIANGRVTPTPAAVKMLAFKAEDKKAYFCKVQLTAVSRNDMTNEQFVEIADTFLEEMIPEIMRVLPDWAEISAGRDTNVASDAEDSRG